MEKFRCRTCLETYEFHKRDKTDFPCVNCWEVEGRLAAYLKSENGLKFAVEAVRQASQERLEKVQST